MRILLVILMILPGVAGSSSRSSLVLQIENIKHSEGVFLLGFYEDSESWKKRKPAFERIISKEGLVDGKLEVTLQDLLHKKYGIAVLDDANNNNKVDFGLIFPLEGFGFSNYYHSSFLAPQYEDFEFSFPLYNKVKIKMRYLE